MLLVGKKKHHTPSPPVYPLFGATYWSRQLRVFQCLTSLLLHEIHSWWLIPQWWYFIQILTEPSISSGNDTFCKWGHLSIKWNFASIKIGIIKVRESSDNLIFIENIYTWKDSLYNEMVPWWYLFSDVLGRYSMYMIFHCYEMIGNIAVY